MQAPVTKRHRTTMAEVGSTSRMAPLAAAAIRVQVISRPAIMVWMRRSFAAVFVALGAKLALTER